MSDVKAAFLGPQAENDKDFEELLLEVFRDYVFWRRNFHPEDGRIIKEADKLEIPFREAIAQLRQELFTILAELKGGVPLYSPRHLGHMVSDQLMAAMIGYVAAMLYNQNNVTGEVSPVTTRREIQYIDALAQMIGMRRVARTEKDSGSWGHLASGGTAANIEALWVARNQKYYAVSLKLLAALAPDFHFMQDLAVDRPGEEQKTETLGALSVRDLLNLSPGRSFALRSNAVAFIQEKQSWDEAKARKHLDAELAKFDIRTLGIAGLVRTCRKISEELPTPKIYVPRTAHYCWKKAVDVLGIGQEALVLVDVDEGYRMQVNALKRAMGRTEDPAEGPTDPTLMIVGVAGTTEEGAFDPLDELVALRNELERDHHYSFWLHADAAWGGYFATLLRGPEDRDQSEDDSEGQAASKVEEKLDGEVAGQIEDAPASQQEEPAASDTEDEDAGQTEGQSPDEAVTAFMKEMIDEVGIEDPFRPESHPITRKWIRRVQALSEMDSVVIDPHKLGYIPYPAGAVLFAEGQAKDAVSFNAPYLSWKGDPEEGLERKFLGQWTLEGSRPGASAIACYLSQRLLPHDRQGHGVLVARTMVAVQRLLRAMEKYNAEKFDAKKFDAKKSEFKIVPLCEPETNVLCYIVSAPEFIKQPQYLNDLAGKIFDGMTVKGDAAIPAHEYFISKTGFPYKDYKVNIDSLLKEAGIPAENWGALDGKELTVLRSVVMNPLVFDLEDAFFDTFWDAVADQARKALPDILMKIVKEKNGGRRLRVLWVEDEASFEEMRQDMEMNELLGKYLDVRLVSKPDKVGEVVSAFNPQISIVDLSLTEEDDLGTGYAVIGQLQDLGMEKIIVYSQYLRDGAEHPNEQDAVSILVNSDLEGLDIPPEFRLAKSISARDRRENDLSLLIRKIFRLAQ